jgi:bifunctional DNase/RNase
MKVFGLALDEQSQVPVLVLKDGAGEKVLPIWIGAMEAMAISLALNEVALPRPMTHDLLLLCIGGLEGAVRRVEVVRLEEGTYYAEIEVLQGEKVKRIDSRPSDAIALALRAKAPIFVAEAILEEVAKEGKAIPVLKTEEAEKWNEMLERFSDDETKYKM